MPIVRERSATVFDYLKDAVLVIDEPSAVESYLGEVYQTLADRYAETDAADDIAVRPEELYLDCRRVARRNWISAKGSNCAYWAALLPNWIRRLRWMRKRQRFNWVAARSVRAPLFLFPVAGQAPEIEWKTQSARKYHGRLADLARRSVERSRRWEQHSLRDAQSGSR